MSQERFDAGMKVRRAVAGAEYVERAYDRADSFDREFQDLVTEYCWGGSWARGVLENKTRSLLNLAMLSALNREHEFKIHFRGALNNGATLDELREVLIQVAIYCGIPAGVTAFRLAREVLREQGIDPDAE